MAQVAYLVIREGSKWSDVFRLVPGQTVSLGRAPTNRIVLIDGRCSRHHAEVLCVNDEWVVRDLESRNGTFVDDLPVLGERTLQPGNVIRIGHTQLAFVPRLNDAFSEGLLPPVSPAEASRAAATIESLPDSIVVRSHSDEPQILHRRGQTRYLDPNPADEAGPSRVGRAAAKLCRLAFELAKAPDVAIMTDLALAGLFESAPVDAGAVFLIRPGVEGKPTPEDLQLVASRTRSGQTYLRVPEVLASAALREGEAVLARNVGDDSELTRPDSQGTLGAANVICAPIRNGATAIGLIHLYSMDAAYSPDAEDLEFTLAVADTVAVAVGNLQRNQELVENLSQVNTEIAQLRQRLGVQTEMIGKSPQIRRITEEIGMAAATKATVLIRGESGSGKELVARAVHFSSARAKNVFVCLNCAALSEDLLASELFGHEKGAFTGATERKIGKFEAAHKGTLMLDEIGEMSQGIQAKFLRVLEGHPFERVGGNKPITVDVRVIAATNRDLERDVAEGRFRRDLFFRLHVLEIIVPPLRKRTEDIPELATFFLQRYCDETGKRIRGYSDDAMKMLTQYRWPGNVRELKNVVERAVVLCAGGEIGPSDLLLSKLPTAGDTVDSNPLRAGFVPCSLAEAERHHILKVLNAVGWNKSKAAQILDIERTTLDRKIRRYELADPGK